MYSGPSGKFRPHVDTPRSLQQIGSLVVSLPCDHKGGALLVRHGGKSQTFDWSTPEEDAEYGSKTPLIQWAAFYSDCEHEVLEVTAGHRVTLTYNLYAVRGHGMLTGQNPVLDCTSLHFYKEARDALANPQYIENGKQKSSQGFRARLLY